MTYSKNYIEKCKDSLFFILKLFIWSQTISYNVVPKNNIFYANIYMNRDLKSQNLA